MNQVTVTKGAPKPLKNGKTKKAWKFIHDINSETSCDLNRIAIVSGTKRYTYGLMFRQWERYASVFSALHMTGADHARVGIMGSTAAETIFTFYGLNMVGAEVSIVASYSVFKTSRIIQTIKEEKLTDFIISDDFAQPNLIQELLENKAALGLRNVIILHIPMYSTAVNSMLTAVQEAKYNLTKSWFAPICMDTLLAAYGDYPVSYTDDAGDDVAVILHTSGTTGGVGKPIVLSDQALNAVNSVVIRASFEWIPEDKLVCALSVDMSSAYGMVNQVHLPLSYKAAIAIVPGGALNPDFYKEISVLKISILFTVGAMFTHWMKMPESTGFDFSSLRCVILGGTAVSAKDKRRFYEFLRAHGSGEITLINGYGIAEMGGACCLSTPHLDDEAIGYTLPGVSFRILDEETNKFLSVKNAPCSGVLYLNSPSMTGGCLDGKEICKIEMINKKPYICTNDAVSVDAAGKLTFLGRANRYFINDSGMKFESGRVETEVGRQMGVESCCVVPVYHKPTHDNVPMLCISTLEKGENAPEIVRKALLRIFKEEQTLPAEFIPYRVLITEELPKNANGKVDVYGIQNGNITGSCFTVETIKNKDCIKDFNLLLYDDKSVDMVQEQLQEIATDIKDSIKDNIRDSMPLNHMKTNGNPANNLFAGMNVINQLGGQMMNMMGMMNYMNQMRSAQQNTNQCTMPYMNRMACQAAMQQYFQNWQMMSQLWQQRQKNMPKTATEE